jgi:UDP-N-acetylmuramoyl-L-alanyl-D-glutamate--2,6-diaminopimelate ligase
MELGALLQKAAIAYDNHQSDRLEVQRIVTDSRLVQPGDLFIGMPGSQVDGGIYAEEVLAKGAIAALVSKNLANECIGEESSKIIPIADIVKASAQIAAAFYDFPAQAMPLVGVTGTNGKTTTTHLIEFLAKSHYSPAMFGTLYSRWQGYTDTAQNTTPFALTLQSQLRQAVDAGSNLGILEVSSHALDQKRVWGCPFRVAVFTNLTQDHLDYHQDLESYFQAKALLFSTDYLPADRQSRAIIHLDDRFGLRLVQKCRSLNIPVWTYSLSNPEADFYPTNLTYSAQGITAILHTPQELGLDSIEINSPLVGSFNVLNLIAAIATCLELKIPLAQIIQTLPQFENVPGRVERVLAYPNQEITVVVDYAHTPDSLENILQALRPFTQRKLICVFGCGGDRDRTKRPIMGKIAAKLADLVYVTSDNPRTENAQTILNDVVKDVADQKNLNIESDRRIAIQTAILAAQPGDTVLIAGKGHEDYQIIGKEKNHFDDREEAKNALALRLNKLS